MRRTDLLSLAPLSLPQVVRRATALTFLDLSYNPALELQPEDVGRVFVHLRRLRKLRMYRGEDEPGEDF